MHISMDDVLFSELHLEGPEAGSPASGNHQAEMTCSDRMPHFSAGVKSVAFSCVVGSKASPVSGCKGEVGSSAGGGDDAAATAAAAAASSTAFLSRQIRAMLHLTTHLAVERHGGLLQHPQYLRYSQPRSL